MYCSLDTLWGKIHKDLEKFIYCRIKDREATKDILHDVYVKAHSNISNLRDETKITSWFFTIARNTIIDYLRNKNSNQDSIEIIDEENDESYMDEFETCLETLINQLKKKYKEAIIQTEWYGLSQKEYAEKLNITYSGAKSRVQRARKMLKKLFTDCCYIQTDKYGNIIDYYRKSECSKKCK
ncbi:MAG: RNA polymerase sigma factor SigZ [Bacteroidales bacterium]|nr:RNA polymerase sigma factor SigZ [Bacteroidales bacterium]